MGLQMKCVLLLVVVATLAICADGRPKPKPKLKYNDDSYKKNVKKQNYYQDEDDHYDHDDHDDHDDCDDDYGCHYEDDKCKHYKKSPPPKKCKQEYDYGYKSKQSSRCGKQTCDDDCDCNSGSYGKKNSNNYGKKSYSSNGYKKY